MLKTPRNGKPLVLIVDDLQRNLQILATILYERDFEVSLAESGYQALHALEQISPDLILLDINMPGMDGYEVCTKLKLIERLKDIPIIFISAKNEPDDILKGFSVGGVDFITKPFNQNELLMRVKTHLELKFSREIIQIKVDEIEEANKKLLELHEVKDNYLKIINSELNVAADYVRSLLPLPITKGEITTSWIFAPSSQLGGDSFGYHWIDEEHFAFYLLDVCGHGIRPALHSVSILILLRFQTLINTDFQNPCEVLSALNKKFQMTEYDGLYFSMWYGVFSRKTRELRYSSAGHPPALLLNQEGASKLLRSTNQGIGILKDFACRTESVIIEKNSNIFIFSDGAFEFKVTQGSSWSIEELYDMLKEKSIEYSKGTNSEMSNESEIEDLYLYIRSISRNNTLEDDFSFLKISFN